MFKFRYTLFSKKKKRKKRGTCTRFFNKGENNYEHGLSTSLKIWV